MRTHGFFAQLRPQQDREKQRHLVRAEYLVAARVETSWSNKFEGLLDLVFSDGLAFALAPFLVVDGVMLIEPEAELLLWPGWMKWLDLEEAERIEAAVAPWLRSLTLARFENGERYRIFSTDPSMRSKIESARSRGWVGIAPSEGVLKTLSPYVHAQRFTHGRNVAIVDEQGANGAALLARSGKRVDADLLDEALMRDAREWFDLDIFKSVDPSELYDVGIGSSERKIDAAVRVTLDAVPGPGERAIEVASPLPMGVMVSFDLDDAPACRHFAVAARPVHARHVKIPEPQPIGGSGGRVALVVRDDASRLADADSDAARILERRLRAEGFDANVVSASRLDVSGVDLVHIFGWRLGSAVREQLDLAVARGVPVALTPYADDCSTESEWGELITLESLRNTGDREMVDEYFEAIGLRRLVSAEIRRPKEAEIQDDTLHLFKSVGTVFVTCPEEEAHVRAAFAFTGTATEVPGIIDWEAPEDVGSLVGPDDFILAHAQLDARTNFYALARASERLGLPVVIVGQVRDAEYYQHVIGAFGPRAIWLPQNRLTPGEIAGLYARARVFADIGWAGTGLHRLGRAAWAGASLATSTSGWAPKVWKDVAVPIDPGVLQAIEAGLKLAWDEAPQRGRQAAQSTPGRFDPAATLVATVKGYQSAQTPVIP